jgi:hypothetical protein
MPPGNLVDYSAPYPSALIPVLLKGLEPDRERRYQSASELMQSIRQALAHLRQPAATDPAALADPGARPADEPAASEAELESMTILLAEFTGPIAAVIMRAHDTRGKPASELALEISRRIPVPYKRGEFLRRWHGISESGKVSSDGKGAKVFPQKSRPHPLLEAVLGKISGKIGAEGAQLVKSISKTFSRQDSKKSPKAG